MTISLSSLGPMLESLPRGESASPVPASLAIEAQRTGDRTPDETGQTPPPGEQSSAPPPHLALPADWPSTNTRAACPAACKLVLPAGPEPATVLAAWQVLLHRLSGQDEFLLEIENSEPTLSPFRALVDGEAPFADLLAARSEPAGSHWPSPTVAYRLGHSSPGGIHAKVRPGINLSLDVISSAAGLQLFCTWDAALFEGTTVARWLSHLRCILEAVAVDPCLIVSRIPLLTVAEREEITIGWNDTATEFPHAATIPQLFAEWSERTPDAVAVIDGSLQLSYAELDRRANAAAFRLRARGVKQDALVGVSAQRSANMIVALLGILKAGAAYVPLDEDQPAGRLQAIRRMCDGLLNAEDLQGEQALAPASLGDAESLAYVIFTSGSTGEPKGVAVPHRAVARLVRNTDYVQLSPRDTVAQASTAAFDAATFEIWGALLNGATLVITPRAAMLSSEALDRHIGAYGINTLFLTTALFNQHARAARSPLGRLKTLLVGGEKADAALMNKVLRSGRPRRLLHVYGPTEATTFATWHEVAPSGAATVPIGRPIANTSAYLLDPHGEPVPIGVRGELYLGGPGLAREYRGAPALTAERFVQTEHGRLYRTGDFARWRVGGVLEFLGRVDHQVKLRGFRIELGEIEAALMKMPGVREARALLQPGVQGDPEITAWYRGTPEPRQLREKLGALLPAYMIPAALVPVREFPLKANGKLDVAALPACSPATQQPRLVDEPVVNTLHVQLLEIWEELLGRTGFTIHDDFFELGGHSLLAARMITLVEQRLGRSPTLAEVWQGATVAQVAESLIGERTKGSAEAPIHMVQTGGALRPFFFVHGDYAAGGFYCQILAQHLGPDRPFLAIHPHGLSGEAPPRTIEAMAADRLLAVRAAQPCGPYLFGGYCNGALIAYEMACQLEAQGERVLTVIMLAADGSNWRNRWVQRVAHSASALRGEAGQAREQRDLLWQQKANFLRAVARHYGTALREAMQAPWRHGIARMARKGRRVLRRFAGGAATPTLVPAGIPVDAVPEMDAVSIAYHDAIAAYVPKKYSAPIVLLWPGDEPSPTRRGPACGWSALTPRAELVTVPGAHHSAISHRANLDHIGREIRDALAAAELAAPLS